MYDIHGGRSTTGFVQQPFFCEQTFFDCSDYNLSENEEIKDLAPLAGW